MKPIVFINTHPIQYFAPLYSYLNSKNLPTEAWYCSDETLQDTRDEEFGTTMKWDIPLLEGYKYIFFKNSSWKPSLKNGFFGLINWGMIRQLYRIPKSVIVVHGWNYFTHFSILMLGKIKGHTVCIRNDMPLAHEAYKRGFSQVIKKIGLKYVLFPRINYFLYIGTENKKFYESYGISASRLASCPYAVDNERFENIEPDMTKKAELGIPTGDKVILFSAKYIEKKRPLDLLQAFKEANLQNTWLVMVGEGELRKEMEGYIQTYNLNTVILTGFVNQLEIVKFYSIADLFVMCSSLGENWGLSVNEAMNSNVPIIASDLTGCSIDLVVDGSNGYIFKTGDVKDLTNKIRAILVENKLTLSNTSKEIVGKYSYLQNYECLKKLAIE